MDLRNQVASLESAKKLDELKVNIDTAFFYVNGRLCTDADNSDCHNSDDVSKYFCLEDGKVYQYADTDEIVNTYTSSELGEMIFRYTMVLPFYNPGLGWQIKQLKDEYHRCKNEADARAKLLIHLLENKLITAEEINKEAK